MSRQKRHGVVFALVGGGFEKRHGVVFDTTRQPRQRRHRVAFDIFTCVWLVDLHGVIALFCRGLLDEHASGISDRPRQDFRIIRVSVPPYITARLQVE